MGGFMDRTLAALPAGAGGARTHVPLLAGPRACDAGRSAAERPRSIADAVRTECRTVRGLPPTLVTERNPLRGVSPSHRSERNALPRLLGRARSQRGSASRGPPGRKVNAVQFFAAPPGKKVNAVPFLGVLSDEKSRDVELGLPPRARDQRRATYTHRVPPFIRTLRRIPGDVGRRTTRRHDCSCERCASLPRAR